MYGKLGVQLDIKIEFRVLFAVICSLESHGWSIHCTASKINISYTIHIFEQPSNATVLVMIDPERSLSTVMNTRMWIPTTVPVLRSGRRSTEIIRLWWRWRSIVSTLSCWRWSTVVPILRRWRQSIEVSPRRRRRISVELAWRWGTSSKTTWRRCKAGIQMLGERIWPII